MSRVEVLSGPERRRRWSAEQKRSIVAEAFAPGASVCEVARRRDVVPGQIYRWRHDLRSIAAGFAEVVVAPEPDERPGAGAGAWRSSSAATFACALRRRRPRSWHQRSSKRWWRDDPVADRVRVWIAAGHTDMRRGMQSLALQVQEALKRDPHAGDLYVFRGRSGSLIKILWHDGIGMSLYAKRLERGRFIWPSAMVGVVSISTSQLAYMLDGIDWRNPQHTWRPTAAG